MLQTRKLDFNLEQVQDFTPTPMTLSTTIYYAGIDPYTMKPVYTARTKDEKLEQRKFFFWYKPEFRRQIDAELRQMGLSDDLGGSAKGGSFNPNFKQNVGWKNSHNISANGENKSKNAKEKKSNFKSRRK